MKIELKKLKIALHLSEETTAFTADLAVNGKVIGFAKNSGHGGSTDVMPYGDTTEQIKANRKTLEEAEAFCKTLPPTQGLKMDLELFIDLLVEEEANKKEIERINKQALKLQETNVLFGVKGKEFRAIGYGPKYKIAELMQSAQGKELVAKLLKSALDKMKAGDEILNTNIDLSLPEFSEIITKLAGKPKTV